MDARWDQEAARELAQGASQGATPGTTPVLSVDRVVKTFGGKRGLRA